MAPAMRYFGAKYRLAPWIIEHFPPHRCYVEPFGGAAGVLIQKPRAWAEVYNDLDGEIVNVFRVLRDPAWRAELIAACRLTPYARAEFQWAWEPCDDPVERARRTVVRAQMGFGSGGACRAVTGFRNDTRRAGSTPQSDWLKYPAALASVGARFEGVCVEQRPALTVMREHDGLQTLHYVDPPYLPETRVLKRHGGYRHELSAQDHRELVEHLRTLAGMVVVSGYASDLYRDLLPEWTLRTRVVSASGRRGGTRRTECLWLNPACLAGLDGGLFAAGGGGP